jgi:hypothetical protein
MPRGSLEPPGDDQWPAAVLCAEHAFMRAARQKQAAVASVHWAALRAFF